MSPRMTCAMPGTPFCVQAKLHTRHVIQREELSVREHMGMILRFLRDNGGFVEFWRMFDVTLGAPVIVVHFLAMLELAREPAGDDPERNLLRRFT